ncbi:ribonuclease H-like domain-containing protein [Gautieria morchelliformis]|nr:ribonuclease H-like domain-containing protein [Gautieria morchelliformis]
MSTFLLLVFAACILSLYWYRSSGNRTNQLAKKPPVIVNGRGPDVGLQPEKISPPCQPWEYFLVLDVEATCVAGTDFNWPNEIIEWPVVLLTWADRDNDGRASQLKVVDEFRSFVRPTWKPKLTEFCATLTGIAQANIDSAPLFTTVLDNFRLFLCQHGLICSQTGQPLRKFAWATDGPFDIRDFVIKQCFISKMKLPEWLRGDIIDVRKHVVSWQAQTQNIPSRKSSARSPPGPSLNISRQLTALSLAPFQGRQHSGIDDTRNIARILIELARRGVKLDTNAKINPNRRWYWMGNQLGEIYEEYFP